MANASTTLTTRNQNTGIEMATGVLNGTANLITATGAATKNISESMSDDQVNEILSKCPTYAEIKAQIVKEATANGKIEPEKAVEMLNNIEKVEAMNAVARVNAQATAVKARSEALNVLIGAGIFTAGAGFGTGAVIFACN